MQCSAQSSIAYKGCITAACKQSYTTTFAWQQPGSFTAVASCALGSSQLAMTTIVMLRNEYRLQLRKPTYGNGSGDVMAPHLRPLPPPALQPPSPSVIGLLPPESEQAWSACCSGPCAALGAAAAD